MSLTGRTLEEAERAAFERGFAAAREAAARAIEDEFNGRMQGQRIANIIRSLSPATGPTAPAKAPPLVLGCVHGRLPGQTCPHCLGVGALSPPAAKGFHSPGFGDRLTTVLAGVAERASADAKTGERCETMPFTPFETNAAAYDAANEADAKGWCRHPRGERTCDRCEPFLPKCTACNGTGKGAR